jgi:hypothetical protein
VKLLDDDELEADETVMLHLSPMPSRLSGGDVMTATLTILENDDKDDDGITSKIEDGVPNPDGSGNGDGNGDGSPDSEQANVSSLPNATEDEAYVTLESPAGTTLIEVEASPAQPRPHNTAQGCGSLPPRLIRLHH